MESNMSNVLIGDHWSNRISSPFVNLSPLSKCYSPIYMWLAPQTSIRAVHKDLVQGCKFTFDHQGRAQKIQIRREDMPERAILACGKFLELRLILHDWLLQQMSFRPCLWASSHQWIFMNRLHESHISRMCQLDKITMEWVGPDHIAIHIKATRVTHIRRSHQQCPIKSINGSRENTWEIAFLNMIVLTTFFSRTYYYSLYNFQILIGCVAFASIQQCDQIKFLHTNIVIKVMPWGLICEVPSDFTLSARDSPKLVLASSS